MNLYESNMHNMRSQFKTKRPKYNMKKRSFMVLN